MAGQNNQTIQEAVGMTPFKHWLNKNMIKLKDEFGDINDEAKFAEFCSKVYDTHIKSQQEKNDKSVEIKGLPNTKDEESTAKTEDGESPVDSYIKNEKTKTNKA